MTKKQKLASLETAMQRKERKDETKFTCFSDSAPKELVDLFLEHFEVRDTDYEIFSDACDVFSTYTIKEIEDEQHRESEFASAYTWDLLGYLDNWNNDEIAGIIREFDCECVSTGCAIWYDRHVIDTVDLLLNEYIKK